MSLVSDLIEIAQRASRYKQEATLRQDFVEVLNRFLGGGPLAALGIRAILDERIIRGRPDARIRGVTFEVELPGRLETGKQQVVDYISEYRRKGIAVRGLAYDGVHLAFFDENCQLLQESGVQEAAITLEAWLLITGAKAATPEDVIDSVGSESPVARDLILRLFKIFTQTRKTSGFVDEFFQVWRSLYGAAGNVNDEARQGIQKTAARIGVKIRGVGRIEEFLFAVETYLSVLLKLLVARVAVQQRLVPTTTLRTLLSPNIVQRFESLDQLVPHLSNVFEHDSFLWFADAARTSRTVEAQLNDVLGRLADAVDGIDLVGVGKDFLRSVYHRFFDRATRRALGEFYTSAELVNETLDAAGYDGDYGKTIIDISCGSGTFLVEAIGRIIRRNASAGKHSLPSAALAEEIGKHVIGIDIHPLAVAMARVNYIISLSPLLGPGHTQVISIPIYWADSLARLTEVVAGITVEVDVPGLGTFELPKPSEISWTFLLEKLRQVLEGFRGRRFDPDAVWHRFQQELDPEIAARFEESLRDFIKKMCDRHNKDRDMRWVPLLRNAIVVEGLYGQVDFVVGNPPWVRIHNIEQGLRDRLRKHFEFYLGAGWRVGAALGGMSLGFARMVDFAMAFVERGLQLLSNAPARRGVLAYVITSKVQQALYANALRQALITQHTLIRIVDYSLYRTQLFEDATNYPMIIALQIGESPKPRDMSIRIYNSGKNHLDFSLPQRRLSLLANDGQSPWVMAPPEIRNIFDKIQRSGMPLGTSDDTRPRLGVMTQLDDIFVVQALAQADRPELVVITNARGNTARLERSVVRLLLRGEDISAWKFAINKWFLWTHDDSSLQPLASLPVGAGRYFSRHKDELIERADYKDSLPYWAIFRAKRGCIGAKVVWTDLSHTMEAVFTPEDWDDGTLGRVAFIPLKTVYYVPASSDAAGLALAAWLNSLPARAYLMTYAERASGAYYRHLSWTVGLLPLPGPLASMLQPKYVGTKIGSSEEKLLERLTEVSRQLHRGERDEAFQNEVDEIASRFCGMDDDDLAKLREFVGFLRGGAEQTGLELGRVAATTGGQAESDETE